MRVREMLGQKLDWAVAVANKMQVSLNERGTVRARKGVGVHEPWSPTTYWNQAGPIIEREQITIDFGDGSFKGHKVCEAHTADLIPMSASEEIVGPSALVAAMRAFVISKLGEHFDIPQGLK